MAALLIGNLGDAAYADPGPRTFTDSLGRRVDVPGVIDAVIPMGDVAQCLVLTLCPEALASLSTGVAPEEIGDFSKAGMGGIPSLPQTGKIADAGFASAAAQVALVSSSCIILDAGIRKEELEDQLELMEQVEGKPAVFLDTSFGSLATAYRMLGQLLGRERRAEELAGYAEGILERAASAISPDAGAPSAFYAPRKGGVQVMRSLDVQIQAMVHIGLRPVTEPYDLRSRQVQVAEVAAAAPDFILYDDTSILPELQTQQGPAWEIWKGAIGQGDSQVFVAPALFYSWLGSLVHVQTIGLLWLCSLLDPARSDMDLVQEAERFYSLFYGWNSDDGELAHLMGIDDRREDDDER